MDNTYRDLIANIQDHRKSKIIPEKNIYFCFIDYAKAIDCVDHNKLRKILQEMGILDHLTCFLRNLYVGQEAAVRTRHGLIQNWEKSTSDLYIVTCLFNLYAEYIMWNAGLDEAQPGISISGRNIKNLRYAYYITLVAEREELKSLLMKWPRRVKKLA